MDFPFYSKVEEVLQFVYVIVKGIGVDFDFVEADEANLRAMMFTKFDFRCVAKLTLASII